MATPNQKAAPNRPSASRRPAAPSPAQAQYLPLEKTLRDAWKLAQRFHETEGFRTYLRRRMALVVPTAALFVLVGIACAAATVIFLADRHSLLALPALILAPFVLVGSLFVQAFVFFSWLEGRALAQALGRRKSTKLDFGKLPRVPWALAALFLFLPLALLAAVSKVTAVVLILLAVLTAVLFARFDR